MSEERRAALTPVAGCQSHVWLDVRREGELLVFDADSDTMLIRGILCLLQQVSQSRPALATICIKQHFRLQIRGQGLANIRKKKKCV